MSETVKRGGNGVVTINTEKGIATKTMQAGKSRESKNRYKNEINALQRLRRLNLNSIVEIIDVDEDASRIVMKAYAGDLAGLFHQTKNNPKFSIELLLPIVETLKYLSEIEQPIYHRDLKPANILYELNDDVPVLKISDFGCCYFAQDDVRETPLFRAVGARSYRAPEYDYGRVENVTSKGDIYSLGKILWAMINGVENEIFPYTLWFPPEYNLLNRFDRTPELICANLIIAKCTSINPDDRPKYEELIDLMDNIVNRNRETVNEEKQLKVQQFAAIQQIELAEVKEYNRNMLQLLYDDFWNALSQIEAHYPELDLLTHLKKEYTRQYGSRETSITHKLENDVASYIFSTSYYNIYFAIDYHPTYRKKDGSPDDKYASISIRYNISSSNKSCDLEIEYRQKVLYSICDNVAQKYSQTAIDAFLEDMVDRYIEAPRV